MIGPLVFEPVLLSKVWGGGRLERIGKRVERGANVGESWEIADLGETSASGAGGGAVSSIVARGGLAGKSLTELMRSDPSAIVGGRGGARGFPLLIKYLDARENLSVQVHPAAHLADPASGLHLKTECWTIIDADPGAMIYKGVKPGVTLADLRAGASEGSIIDMIQSVPAVVGETHNLPSGTVHALGAGVLVAEVQTPSDTTFRLYDWGRTGRALHVEESLRHAMLAEPPHATSYQSPLADPGVCDPWRRIVRTEFFLLDEARVGRGKIEASREREMCVLMLLRGGGALCDARGKHQPFPISLGETVLIPAECWGGAASVFEASEDCVLLRATVPSA